MGKLLDAITQFSSEFQNTGLVKPATEIATLIQNTTDTTELTQALVALLPTPVKNGFAEIAEKDQQTAELVALLLKQGANANAVKNAEKQQTVLHYAVLSNLYKTCSVLLKYGAAPKAADSRKLTPHDYAMIAMEEKENRSALPESYSRKTKTLFAQRDLCERHLRDCNRMKESKDQNAISSVFDLLLASIKDALPETIESIPNIYFVVRDIFLNYPQHPEYANWATRCLRIDSEQGYQQHLKDWPKTLDILLNAVLLPQPRTLQDPLFVQTIAFLTSLVTPSASMGEGLGLTENTESKRSTTTTSGFGLEVKESVAKPESKRETQVPAATSEISTEATFALITIYLLSGHVSAAQKFAAQLPAADQKAAQTILELEEHLAREQKDISTVNFWLKSLPADIQKSDYLANYLILKEKLVPATKTRPIQSLQIQLGFAGNQKLIAKFPPIKLAIDINEMLLALKAFQKAVQLASPVISLSEHIQNVIKSLQQLAHDDPSICLHTWPIATQTVFKLDLYKSLDYAVATATMITTYVAKFPLEMNSYQLSLVLQGMQQLHLAEALSEPHRDKLGSMLEAQAKKSSYDEYKILVIQALNIFSTDDPARYTLVYLCKLKATKEKKILDPAIQKIIDDALAEKNLMALDILLATAENQLPYDPAFVAQCHNQRIACALEQKTPNLELAQKSYEELLSLHQSFPFTPDFPVSGIAHFLAALKQLFTLDGKFGDADFLKRLCNNKLKNFAADKSVVLVEAKQITSMTGQTAERSNEFAILLAPIDTFFKQAEHLLKEGNTQDAKDYLTLALAICAELNTIFTSTLRTEGLIESKEVHHSDFEKILFTKITSISNCLAIVKDNSSFDDLRTRIARLMRARTDRVAVLKAITAFRDTVKTRELYAAAVTWKTFDMIQTPAYGTQLAKIIIAHFALQGNSQQFIFGVMKLIAKFPQAWQGQDQTQWYQGIEEAAEKTDKILSTFALAFARWRTDYSETATQYSSNTWILMFYYSSAALVNKQLNRDKLYALLRLLIEKTELTLLEKTAKENAAKLVKDKPKPVASMHPTIETKNEVALTKSKLATGALKKAIEDKQNFFAVKELLENHTVPHEELNEALLTVIIHEQYTEDEILQIAELLLQYGANPRHRGVVLGKGISNILGHEAQDGVINLAAFRNLHSVCILLIRDGAHFAERDSSQRMPINCAQQGKELTPGNRAKTIKLFEDLSNFISARSGLYSRGSNDASLQFTILKNYLTRSNIIKTHPNFLLFIAYITCKKSSYTYIKKDNNESITYIQQWINNKVYLPFDHYHEDILEKDVKDLFSSLEEQALNEIEAQETKSAAPATKLVVKNNRAIVILIMLQLIALKKPEALENFIKKVKNPFFQAIIRAIHAYEDYLNRTNNQESKSDQTIDLQSKKTFFEKFQVPATVLCSSLFADYLVARLEHEKSPGLQYHDMPADNFVFTQEQIAKQKLLQSDLMYLALANNVTARRTDHIIKDQHFQAYQRACKHEKSKEATKGKNHQIFMQLQKAAETRDQNLALAVACKRSKHYCDPAMIKPVQYYQACQSLVKVTHFPLTDEQREQVIMSLGEIRTNLMEAKALTEDERNSAMQDVCFVLAKQHYKKAVEKTDFAAFEKDILTANIFYAEAINYGHADAAEEQLKLAHYYQTKADAAKKPIDSAIQAVLTPVADQHLTYTP